MDTGSPKSIMIREFVDNLVKKEIAVSGNLVIESEGINVELELHLGTDFLNAVVLIDDFVSKTIIFLRLAHPPRAAL